MAKRLKNIHVMVTEEEVKKVQDAAHKDHRTVSSWVRKVISIAAEEQLNGAPSK